MAVVAWLSDISLRPNPAQPVTPETAGDLPLLDAIHVHLFRVRSSPLSSSPQKCRRHCSQSSTRYFSQSTLFLHISQVSQFMDKKLLIELQGKRKITGRLRGFDIFLNLVLDEACEVTRPAQKDELGEVVRCSINFVMYRTPADSFTSRSFEATVST